MKKTKLSAVLLVLSFVLLMSACSNNQQSNKDSGSEVKSEISSEESIEAKIFTLEELAKYDGQNGNPAYVAVDGVVYDVTSIGAWKNGKHNGLTAGKDLTEEIKTMSPHGVSKLESLDIVGTLEEGQ